MKKVNSLLAICLAITGQACAQKSNTQEAPKQVQESFTQKFPNVKKVTWEKENELEWEAEFKVDGVEYSANFTNEGAWKETEHEIKKSDIPTLVKQRLETDYPKYKIEEVEISETETGVLYELALEQGEKEVEVSITSEGKIVSKKEIKEDENDED